MSAATMVVIIVILVIIYVTVAVLTAMAASEIADDPSYDDNPDLGNAHMYLSWATSICWIIFGLSILGIILLVILAIIGGITVGAEAAAAYGVKAAGSLGAQHAETQKEIQSGFLGVQELNSKGGLFGTFFKIFFGLMLIILTGVGILCLLGLFSLLQSDSRPAISYTLISVFLCFLPLTIFILLEIANYLYLRSKREKLEAEEEQLRQIKLDLINKKLERGGYDKPSITVNEVPSAQASAPIAKTSVPPAPVTTTPATSNPSLYTFSAPPATTPAVTSTTSNPSLYTFTSTAPVASSSVAPPLYTFS